MQPTYEQLLEENKELKRRIAFLEERLGLNSKNSSNPPSSDQKAKRQAPKGRGKKGHQGHHRPPVPKDQVDSIITSDLTSCPHCGSHDLKQRDPWILQQSDIPKIKPYITQIECAKALCNTYRKRGCSPSSCRL